MRKLFTMIMNNYFFLLQMLYSLIFYQEKKIRLIQIYFRLCQILYTITQEKNVQS